uniref:Uncharacterized protein n=1 Tax=Glossina austeni TaxID=7395 RepID=A0A1A9VQG8_GLOAU
MLTDESANITSSVAQLLVLMFIVNIIGNLSNIDASKDLSATYILECCVWFDAINASHRLGESIRSLHLQLFKERKKARKKTKIQIQQQQQEQEQEQERQQREHQNINNS